MIVGSSTREDVINIMKDISKVHYSITSVDSIFFYHDISVNVIFNPSGIISELQFGSKYRGETTLGLRVGDSVEKAVELYGQPKMKAARGGMWNHFSLFSENNYITCIRIQN